jgi:hypothetical protein
VLTVGVDELAVEVDLAARTLSTPDVPRGMTPTRGRERPGGGRFPAPQGNGTGAPDPSRTRHILSLNALPMYLPLNPVWAPMARWRGVLRMADAR